VIRFLSRRLSLGLTFAVLLVGCATLPELHPWFAARDGAGTPTVVGARGPLSREQVAAVLERLQTKSGSTSDLLARHIAIEEAAAGQPLTVGNHATLLRDGPATYQSMFQAMAAARDHINIEFYTVEADEIGRKFADLLLRKAAEGLSVNLMYDSVGSNGTPREYFDTLRKGGVKVLEFNPVNPLKARRGWRVNNRNHRKVVVVDGRVAFTGGINISEVYSRSSSSTGAPHGGFGYSASGMPPESGDEKAVPRARRPGWRETNVRIAGPAVEQLQRIFLDTWSNQRGETLPQRNWYPAPTPQGEHPVRIVASGPATEVPAIYVSILTAIAHAEKSVHITMAYFVPDPQAIAVLKEAAARGVDVTLVLPSYTDFWAVFHAGRSHYSDLLDAGIKIYERQQALLHSKTVVIDGVWSSVGSSNLDWRSFLHNDELNAVVLGWDFGRQMEAMFESDVRDSVRVARAAWSRRPVETRMKEWLGRAWEYWL
jgi:cardiolipin synthase A/B